MGTKMSRGTAAVTLPTDTQILIRREFDALPHLVWKAWTTPELVRRWWHANRGTMKQAEIDLRVGGKWRFVMVTDTGFEVAFHGEYREIVPNEKLVHTEVYEGAPPGPDGEEATLNTILFQQVGNRTLVTSLCEARTQAVRDAIIDSGMESGLQDALDLLEQVAISLG